MEKQLNKKKVLEYLQSNGVDLDRIEKMLEKCEVDSVSCSLSEIYAATKNLNNPASLRLIEEYAQENQKVWLKAKAALSQKDTTCIRSFKGHNNFVGGMVFVEERQLLTSSEDSTMKLWDLDTGKIIEEFYHHRSPINFLHLDKETNELLTASDDNTCAVWDADSWEVEQVLKGHTNYVRKAKSNGVSRRAVTIGSDGGVGIWDMNTGKKMMLNTDHGEWVCALAMSPDGKYAVTGAINSSMFVWDLVNGKKLQEVIKGSHVHWVMGSYIGGANTSGIGHAEGMHDAIWIGEDRVATAAKDIIIWHWDGTSLKESLRLAGHSWSVNRMCTSNNNTILWSVAHTLKAWNLNTGEELLLKNAHDGDEIYSVAISPDEKYVVTGGKKGDVKVWDLQQLLDSPKIMRHTSYAERILINKEQRRVATGAYEAKGLLWDMDTGEGIAELKGYKEMGVKPLDYYDNGKKIVVSCRGQIKVWNSFDGSLHKELTVGAKLHDPNCGVVFGGQLMTGSMSYQPRMFDLEKGTDAPGNSEAPFYHFHRDADALFITTYPSKFLDAKDYNYKDPDPIEGPLYLFDLKEGIMEQEFWLNRSYPEGHKDKIYPNVALFDTSKEAVIAVYSDGTIAKWDRESGDIIKEVNIIESDKKYISTMFKVQNGEMIVKPWYENQLIVMDDDLNVLRKVQLPGEKAFQWSYDKETNLIAFMHDDKNICIMDAQSLKIISKMCFPVKIRELLLDAANLYLGAHDGRLHIYSLENYK